MKVSLPEKYDNQGCYSLTIWIYVINKTKKVIKKYLTTGKMKYDLNFCSNLH